tara:strand:+ start:728 stop:1012 length:285 start_codon:yes stop_codon:yes gene_type:complete
LNNGKESNEYDKDVNKNFMDNTTITIRYGMSNSVSRAFNEDYTVGSLLRDTSILGALSAPEGCVAVSNGQTLSNESYVADFTSITLERQASSKA